MLQSVVLQIHRNVFSSNQTPLCSEPICFYRFQFSDRFKKPISLKVLAHFFNRLGMKSSRTQARVCKMWLICWENSLANPSLDCVYVCVCVCKWILGFVLKNGSATHGGGATFWPLAVVREWVRESEHVTWLTQVVIQVSIHPAAQKLYLLYILTLTPASQEKSFL